MSTACDTHCAHALPADRWDRKISPFDGQPKTRVTTFVGQLGGNANGLVAWNGGRVIEGLAADPDLRALIDTATTEDERRALAKQAAEVGGAGKAAGTGVTFHDGFVAMVNDEAPPEGLSDDALSQLRQIKRRLAQDGLRVVSMEQTVAVLEDDAVISIGQYDVLLVDQAGTHYVGDLKTSAGQSERKYPLKVSAQLAAYAHGRRLCPQTTGFWLPTPAIDQGRAILISAPQGTTDVFVDEVDIRVGWEAFTTAVWLKSASRERLVTPFWPVKEPVTA